MTNVPSTRQHSTPSRATMVARAVGPVSTTVASPSIHVHTAVAFPGAQLIPRHIATNPIAGSGNHADCAFDVLVQEEESGQLIESEHERSIDADVASALLHSTGSDDATPARASNRRRRAEIAQNQSKFRPHQEKRNKRQADLDYEHDRNGSCTAQTRNNKMVLDPTGSNLESTPCGENDGEVLEDEVESSDECDYGGWTW